MSSDNECLHSWGDSEEVETPQGTVFSPLCRHCGAVKIIVGRQAAERRRAQWLGHEALLPAAPAAKETPTIQGEFAL